MSPTIAEAALDYHTRRKWKPVPISRKTKKPIGKKWQERPYDPAQFDGNAQNVGIQLGEVSGGLVDIDLDTMMAVGFAPAFLPTTDAIFGRRSKPCSHQLYVSDLYKTETRAVIQYAQHLKNGNGKLAQGQMIVELRIGGNGKGATTVAPPSMHETGETVQWERDGEPARVAGDELTRAVRKIAVACALKPYYPGQGSRHEGAKVLGGVLARAGWSADDIGHLMMEVARAAGDDEIDDRVRTAAEAVNVKANGHDVPGFERLREVWGDEVADTLGHWLKVRGLRADKGIGLEDRVALDFAAQHANHFRYIAESSQWMRWAGFLWKAEKTLLAFDQSRKLCRVAGDPRARTVSAVTTLARSDRRMAADLDQWDSDDMLLNTPSTQEGKS
jgi:hypothetical protein